MTGLLLLLAAIACPLLAEAFHLPLSFHTSRSLGDARHRSSSRRSPLLCSSTGVGGGAARFGGRSKHKTPFAWPRGPPGEISIMAPKSLPSMTPAEFAALHDNVLATPAVLTDVWAHGEQGREDWCQDVVQRLGSAAVEFQLQTESHSELLTGSFEEFLEAVFESTHNNAFFLFDENLMTQHTDLRDSLALPEAYFGRNLFESFAPGLRPKDACLVVGGEGARSTLHADPFDWMGTNYCLEGSKLWTFIAPDALGASDKHIASAIHAYRVEPNAWDNVEEDGGDQDGNNQQRPEIAAGWQSDLNIYASLDDIHDWPSCEHLSEMEPAQRIESLNEILRGAARSVPQGTWRAQSIKASQIHMCLQREGDLVLIPPGWWHQTLHLEPSIALASQYTNSRNIHAVLNHISEWCQLERAELEIFEEEDSAAISAAIEVTLRDALEAVRGREGGGKDEKEEE